MPADVKRQIANTLLQLLEKKSLEKITVKELVALCGISRQTFYYHFEDVLDVVDWWTRQGAQQLMEESMRTDDPRKALRLFVDYTAGRCSTFWPAAGGNRWSGGWCRCSPPICRICCTGRTPTWPCHRRMRKPS